MLNLPTKKPTICSINVPLFVALSTKLSKLPFQSSHPNKYASPEKEDQRNSGVTWVTTVRWLVPMCFHDAHQSLVNHYMVFFLHPPERLQRILIFIRQMHQKDRASFPFPPKKSRFRSMSTVPVEHSHAPNQIYSSFENPYVDLHLGIKTHEPKIPILVLKT